MLQRHLQSPCTKYIALYFKNVSFNFYKIFFAFSHLKCRGACYRGICRARAQNQQQRRIEKKLQHLWIYIWRGFMLQTPTICLLVQPLSENTKNSRFDLRRLFFRSISFLSVYLYFENVISLFSSVPPCLKLRFSALDSLG